MAGEVDGGAVAPEVAKAKGQTLRLSGQMIDMVAPDQLPKLPTPISSDAKGTGPADTNRETTQLRAINVLLPTVTTQESHSGPSQLNRNTVPLNSLAITMFPTPAVSDNRGAARSEVLAGDPKRRLKVAVELLPTADEMKLGTPRASAARGPTAKQVAAGAPKSRLEDQIESASQGIIDWGKFELAIRRWEQVIERKAPAPTKPDGKDGNHRLSSAFTEWMMGLPEGWITDVGLKRNEELKACGNGVVPQQAELALRILLDGLPFTSTGIRVSHATN